MYLLCLWCHFYSQVIEYHSNNSPKAHNSNYHNSVLRSICAFSAIKHYDTGPISSKCLDLVTLNCFLEIVRRRKASIKIIKGWSESVWKFLLNFVLRFFHDHFTCIYLFSTILHMYKDVYIQYSLFCFPLEGGDALSISLWTSSHQKAYQFITQRLRRDSQEKA